MTPEQADCELDNWGRWMRASDGDPAHHGFEPSIWRAYVSFKGRTAGWGLTEAEKELERLGIDVTPSSLIDWEPPAEPLSAWATEGRMRLLRVCSPSAWVTLRRFYYKRSWVDSEPLQEALGKYCKIYLDKTTSPDKLFGAGALSPKFA